MKFGIRKPSLKKSIKARTTGKLKRAVKKSINPFYGKKGMGFINNPKKAIYNKVYNKTTIGLKDVVKNSTNFFNNKKLNKKKSIESLNKNKDNKENFNQDENLNVSNKKERINNIIVWIISIYSVLIGIFSYSFNISNILFILAGLSIMPSIVKKVTEKTTKYSKKVKWIVFIILTLFAYGTYPLSNTVEVNNNVSQEQQITENYTINYLNAESLEEDLNNGIDVNGKIVKFNVREYVKDSAAGYNAHSGEHLNFISETDLNLENDVEVVGKVKSYKDFLGSWIINYEMIEIDSSAKEQAQREAEEHAKKEAEEQAKKEAEEKAKQEAKLQAQREAEEKARQQAAIQSETTVRTVYRTPTGKRYHFDPDCGGKNSTSTTLESAQSSGLTPCQKCAQ